MFVVLYYFIYFIILYYVRYETTMSKYIYTHVHCAWLVGEKTVSTMCALFFLVVCNYVHVFMQPLDVIKLHRTFYVFVESMETTTEIKFTQQVLFNRCAAALRIYR